MIDKLYQALTHSIDYQNTEYSSVVKRNVMYPFERAELRADVSLEIRLRRNQSPYRTFLFVDATKVFKNGTVDDAVKAMPYQYGKPDHKDVIVHFFAEGGFTKEAITTCNQYPWMRLMRLAKGKKDTILHRAYHTPGTFDADQDDFLAEDAKKSQIYLDKQFRSIMAYWEEQGVPIKKELKFKPDVLHATDIQQKVNNLLEEITKKSFSKNDMLQNVADYLEVKIVYQVMDDEQLGYYSLEDNAIFINARHRNHENYRDRFTLAHELGHRFLHHDLLRRYKMDRTDDDNWGNICNAFMTDASRNWSEWQANQFASYILLPEDELRKAFVVCAIYLRNANICAENMRKVVQMQYLWADPHDKLVDNRHAAYALLTELSNRMRVSKEALRYRLIDLHLVKSPNSNRNTLVRWMTE